MATADLRFPGRGHRVGAARRRHKRANELPAGRCCYSRQFLEALFLCLIISVRLILAWKVVRWTKNEYKMRQRRHLAAAGVVAALQDIRAHRGRVVRGSAGGGGIDCPSRNIVFGCQPPSNPIQKRRRKPICCGERYGCVGAAVGAGLTQGGTVILVCHWLSLTVTRDGFTP